MMRRRARASLLGGVWGDEKADRSACCVARWWSLYTRIQRLVACPVHVHGSAVALNLNPQPDLVGAFLHPRTRGSLLLYLFLSTLPFCLPPATPLLLSSPDSGQRAEGDIHEWLCESSRSWFRSEAT